jgi:hypothetical protein
MIFKDEYTQQEIESYVEDYILERTGRKVKIVIHFRDPFTYQLQMQMLMEAFGYVYCYEMEKNRR